MGIQQYLSRAWNYLVEAVFRDEKAMDARWDHPIGLVYPCA